MKKENSMILLGEQLDKAIIGIKGGSFVIGNNLCRDVYNVILEAMKKKKLPRLTSESIEFQETIFKGNKK
jgi:hypothetical protein